MLIRQIRNGEATPRIIAAFELEAPRARSGSTARR
jgi:hypothetical protein